jgi:hypothetical protein
MSPKLKNVIVRAVFWMEHPILCTAGFAMVNLHSKYRLFQKLIMNLNRPEGLVLENWKVVPLRSIEAHLDDRRYSSYPFLTSALEGGEGSASRPGRALPPGERAPDTHCTGGWVGPRAGLDTKSGRKILCLCRGSIWSKTMIVCLPAVGGLWAGMS